MKTITFSAAELGMMKQVISLLQAATLASERKPLLSKITSFTASMISLRSPATKRPSIFITQIQQTHYVDTQDIIYTICYEEKQNAIPTPKKEA